MCVCVFVSHETVKVCIYTFSAQSGQIEGNIRDIKLNVILIYFLHFKNEFLGVADTRCVCYIRSTVCLSDSVAVLSFVSLLILFCSRRDSATQNGKRNDKHH